nr:ORF3 [Serpentovirales sp.]
MVCSHFLAILRTHRRRWTCSTPFCKVVTEQMLWLVITAIFSQAQGMSFDKNKTELALYAPGITPYPGNITTPYLLWNDFLFLCRQCFVVDNKTWIIVQQPAPGVSYNGLSTTSTINKYFILNETARIHLQYYPFFATIPQVLLTWFYDGVHNHSIPSDAFRNVPAVLRTGHLGIDRNAYFSCEGSVDKYYNYSSCTYKRPQDFYIKDITYGLEVSDIPRIPCLEVEPNEDLIRSKALEVCNRSDIFDCPELTFVEPVLPSLDKFCPKYEPPATYHYYIYGVLGFIILTLLLSAPVAIKAIPQQNGYQRLSFQPPRKSR